MMEKYLGVGLLAVAVLFILSKIEELFHFHDPDDDKIEFDYKDFDDIDHLLF